MPVTNNNPHRDKPDPPGTDTRRAALRLLDAVLRQGIALEVALPNATRGLPREDDRRLAHAIAAEVLRRLPDLDALIDSATQKPMPEDSKARMALRIALAQSLALGTPAHAAISTALALLDGGPRRLVHGVFGTLSRKNVRLPAMPSFPETVTARWRKAWGAERVSAARESIATPPPLDLSVKGDAAAWAKRLGGESLAIDHVRVPRGGTVANMPGYGEGAWWVQDIAATIPARLIGAGPAGGTGRALDLCAAPGGKTLQLAAAGWDVTALDDSAPRLARLEENLARTKLAATIVDADMLEWTPDAPFDAVLLDAPCSATGIFRRHPDVLHRVTDAVIAERAANQARLIARAAQWVRPGGVLVYAVCSLEPSEGEDVAAAFLASHPEFATAAATAGELPVGIVPDDRGHVRVAPGMLLDHGGADGFFVARFRKG
jgi:16S rRNA (cytosine967-C5)-methyltransferase